MDRRNLLKGLVFGGVSLSASCGKPGRSGSAGGGSASKTLRIISSQSLVNLDPIWSTAPGPKDYGFMTFDQLVAVDADYVPRPQMAEGWSIEDNGRSYVFGLRDGLKFHDGTPVRSQDCIPSIKRWGVRDGFGQMMMKFVDTMEVIDDRRFRIRLKRPFALLPTAIGKSAASECFIMPEHMASTDPFKQVTESIGSGPYRFLKDEWVAGSHAAFARFDGYIPRKDPVSGIAGGRIPAMQRVEWTNIDDPSTAMAALMSGEQDYWDIVPADLASNLKAAPNIKVEVRNPTGAYLMMQFNHLQPPFNNLAVRQAVAMAVDQNDFLRASVADPKNVKPCYSYYACGTPYASEAGADILKVKSADRAKAALKTAGYRGEKGVLLGVHSVALTPASQVADDILRRIGMNVEYVVVDFATLAQRRTSKAPVGQGGWSAFITAWTGADILNPGVNQMLRGAGEHGYAGWADDPKLETLRDHWASAIDPAEQKRLATAIQVHAFKTLPYLPLGSVFSQVAYRDDVAGVFPAPVFAYWNMRKAA